MGEVDGVWLDEFLVGHVYDLATPLATYLITTHCAELADVDSATTPTDDPHPWI